MEVSDPGHVYLLRVFDFNPEIESSQEELVFMKREGEGYPGNVGHYSGTNCQEVIRALINRVEYLDKQISHNNNLHILANLRQSIWLFEVRAAERHGRLDDFMSKYPNSDNIEKEPTCEKCGHIGCDGNCH